MTSERALVTFPTETAPRVNVLQNQLELQRTSNKDSNNLTLDSHPLLEVALSAVYINILLIRAHI